MHIFPSRTTLMHWLFLGTRASGPQIQTMQVSEPLKGWHSRGYHPHLDAPPLVQSVTFRLHDSVPAKLLERWRSELSMIPPASGEHRRMGNVTRPAPRSRDATALRRRIENYEDAGHGECWLRHPRIAKLVQEALHHFDGKRYRILEWCVMPNLLDAGLFRSLRA